MNLRTTKEKFFTTFGGHKVELIRPACTEDGRPTGDFIVKFHHAHRIEGLLYPAGAKWTMAVDGKLLWSEEFEGRAMLNIAGVWVESIQPPEIEGKVIPVAFQDPTLMPDLPVEAPKKKTLMDRLLKRINT